MREKETFLLSLSFVNVRRLCSNQTADWFLQISIGAEVVVSKTVKKKRKEKKIRPKMSYKGYRPA